MRAAKPIFVCQKQNRRYQCKGYEEGSPLSDTDVLVSGEFGRLNTDARIVRADRSARRCRTHTAGRSWTCEHARADDELIERLLTYFTAAPPLPPRAEPQARAAVRAPPARAAARAPPEPPPTEPPPTAPLAEEAARRRAVEEAARRRAVQDAPTTQHVILINQRDDGQQLFWKEEVCTNIGSSSQHAQGPAVHQIGLGSAVRYIKGSFKADARDVVHDALNKGHPKTVIALIAPSGAGKTHQSQQIANVLLEQGYAFRSANYVYGRIALTPTPKIVETFGTITAATMQAAFENLQTKSAKDIDALFKSSPLNETSSRFAVSYKYVNKDDETVCLVDAGGSEDETKIEQMLTGSVSRLTRQHNAANDLKVSFQDYKNRIKEEGRYINCLLASMAQQVNPNSTDAAPFSRTSTKIHKARTTISRPSSHARSEESETHETPIRLCADDSLWPDPLRLLFDCNNQPLAFEIAKTKLGFDEAEVRLVFVVPDKLPDTTTPETAGIMAAAVSELVCLCNNQGFDCGTQAPAC